MPDAFLRRRLVGGLRRIVIPLGEFVHVSAIYVGLAVLTALGLSLILPSMREQSRQLHEVVLTLFQSDDRAFVGLPDDNPAFEWTVPVPPSAVMPDALAHSDQSDTPDASVLGGGSQAYAPEGELYNFTQALLASMRDLPIEGLTRAQDHALRSYLARKYKLAPSVAGAFVRTAFVVGNALQVDPQLLLAVIAIESHYNPFVESPVGAQGLMQVMTRVHDDKLRPQGGKAAVFDPVVNIRVGAQILADCIQRRGSLRGGLACYVGATGPGDGGYGNRVLAERRRIALASGIPPDPGS